MAPKSTRRGTVIYCNGLCGLICISLQGHRSGLYKAAAATLNVLGLVPIFTLSEGFKNHSQRGNMALGKRIQALLDKATSDPIHGIPGAVFVAVDRTGAQIAANASGVRGLNEKTPMTLDTIFYIASCTKLITAIAALQLVEQGKLYLDDAEQVCGRSPAPCSNMK